MRKQRERDSIRFGDSLRARALVVDGEVAKGNEAIIRFLGQFQHDAECKTESVLLRLWTVPKHMSSRATRPTYRSLRAILPAGPSYSNSTDRIDLGLPLNAKNSRPAVGPTGGPSESAARWLPSSLGIC